MLYSLQCTVHGIIGVTGPIVIHYGDRDSKAEIEKKKKSVVMEDEIVMDFGMKNDLAKLKIVLVHTDIKNVTMLTERFFNFLYAYFLI